MSFPCVPVSQSIEPIILSVDESAEISIRDVALLNADAVGIAPENVVVR